MIIRFQEKWLIVFAIRTSPCYWHKFFLWSFLIKLHLKYEVILPHIPQKLYKIPYADADIQMEENSFLPHYGNLFSMHFYSNQYGCLPCGSGSGCGESGCGHGWGCPSCWGTQWPMDSTEVHPEQFSLLDSFTCDFLTLLPWFSTRVILLLHSIQTVTSPSMKTWKAKFRSDIPLKWWK